ncbi:MAG: oligosaccharide flippase family protein [Massilibacteroides sp.]|nr:oligosaccharide flippase family protein [Massilibacteroides sp.]
MTHEDETVKKKRIVKNTMLLYGRMFFVLLITLYTSRIVLATLGVENFGIYNVVGGIVGMFAVVTRSLGVAISRFITVELGKQSMDGLKRIFSTSMNIQLILSAVIVLVGETVGVWFLYNYMNIDALKMHAAFWVFQLSIATFVVNLINIPYYSLLIAHERMTVIAYVGIIEVLLKLAIVYMITLTTYDKLIVYTFLLLMVSIIIRFIYGFYCSIHFKESKFRILIDKPLLKEMLSFASWEFIGSAAAIFRTQGVNIVVNMFFGVVVNAARGVTTQVNSAVSQFFGNFMMALNPQIIKSYAENNRPFMVTLVQQGSRFSSYLMLLICLPLFMETRFVLSVWLVEIPPQTINFVRLVLIGTFVDAMAGTLISALSSIGRIKVPSMIVGGMMLLNLPIVYFLLKLGAPAESAYVVLIIISFLSIFLRLAILKRQMNFPVLFFIKKVMINLLLVTVAAVVVPLLIYSMMEDNTLRFFILGFVCVLSTLISIYYIGCTKEERILLLSKTKTFIANKMRKNV